MTERKTLTTARRADLGRLVGRIAFYRGKGSIWLDMLRSWVLPALGGGAALKYLGLKTSWAVLAMLGLAVAMEICAVLLGWLERRSGATREHYEVAKLTDPYKVESLRLLTEIRDGMGRR